MFCEIGSVELKALLYDHNNAKEHKDTEDYLNMN